MDSKFLQGGLRLLSSARQSGRLGFGHLVKPKAWGDDKGAARMEGWCLRGDVHPQMFSEVSTTGIKGQIGRLVKLQNGHQFFVLAQQAGVWQHRFVLALEGASVRRCLQDCQLQALKLSLNTAQEPKSFMTTCTLNLPGVEGLPKDDVDTSDFLYEQAALVMQMLLVQAVQIDGMPAAEDVCVSVVKTSGNHADLHADLQLLARLVSMSE